MWMMFGWLSWAASLASSMNMLMKSVLPVMYGRIFLIATVFWNPSTPRMRAFHTSAMPPTAMRSSSVYCPKVSPAGSGFSRGTIWMRWVASELSPPGSTLPGGAGGGAATRGAPVADAAVDAAAGVAGREDGTGAWEASPGRDDGSTLRPAFAISSISDRAIAPVIRRRTPVESAADGGDGGGAAGGGPGRTGAGPAAAAAAAAGAAGAVGAAGTTAAAGGAGVAAVAATGGVGMAATGGVGMAATGGADAGTAAAGAVDAVEVPAGGDAAAAGWTTGAATLLGAAGGAGGVGT